MTFAITATGSCPRVRNGLLLYLRGQLSQARETAARSHLDRCEPCWSAWNRLRWDVAAASPLYRDLEKFLGPRFVPYLDSSRQLAADWEAAAPASPAEVAAFFRRSEAYLYNLTIWEASGNRPHYLTAALPALRRVRPTVVLDYGCGIGSDTIALREHGYSVLPCDFRFPSTAFFRWRSQRRGLLTEIFEPSELEPAAATDALWMIDTVDHLPDIRAAIGHLLEQARLVVTENIRLSRTHGQQRFHHRRSPNEVQAIFSGYGLRPHPDVPRGPVITWTRCDRRIAGMPEGRAHLGLDGGRRYPALRPCAL